MGWGNLLVRTALILLFRQRNEKIIGVVVSTVGPGPVMSILLPSVLVDWLKAM